MTFARCLGPFGRFNRRGLGSGPHPGAIVIARAAGRWEPSGLVDDGAGKVQQWTNSGTGGTKYDLLTVTAGTRPTLSATGDRAGTGPACTLVRASATKLATVAFTLDQPNTMLWIAKITSGKAANMRMYDGRTGNTHGIYLGGAGLSPVVNDGAGTTIYIAANFTQDVWNIVAGVYNGNGASASRGWLGSTKTTGTLAGTSCSGICVGDFGTGGGAAFDGVLERGYCWTEALSDTDVAAVKQFLAI